MEVLPNAIQIMAKSAGEAGLTVNGTVKEMMELQQQGGLISSKVLPVFAKNMRLAVQVNGGLDKALESNRVKMQQLVFAARDAANNVFTSGWGEGLSELFDSLTDLMVDNEAVFKSFGRIMGKVFKGLAVVIDEIIEPAFSALGSILTAVADGMDELGNWVGGLLIYFARFSPILGSVIKAFGGFRGIFLMLLGFGKRILLPFTLLLGVLEEIAEFFSPSGKKTLVGTNFDEVSTKLSGMLSDFTKVKDRRQEAPLPSYLTGIDKPLPNTPNYPIHFRGDIYMDSEKVGQQVMQTESADSTIQSKISPYIGGNY